MPAGTSTSTFWRRTSIPRPPQVSHGDSATRPSPPQVSQIAVRTSWPKRVRATFCVWPEPWQVGQATIGVPGSAPLPRQVSHSTVAS